MIIQCESCSRKFIVKDSNIPKDGRTVQCGYCSVTWHQMPVTTPTRAVKKPQISKPVVEADESPSVDSIKASDGKTYRFLGSQWAELLPSGKTGLFARKKISQELDEITGRKEIKVTRKRKKKLEEVDPSSGGLDSEKQLSDTYKPKQGLGFFGYIFLLIIIGFSVVGVLRTFENDLLNTFPQTEYIYELLDEQLEFLAESVKNIIVIINDLIDSY
ncbi:uncharacterized protein METZ01_LOCUS217795 [marine metagenome]|uniref:Zinc finger/thioredoxin putative domain-containing protein n=1 Tax=marine metagenome TaxID=408172 RepID=A0A382FSI9_9ZZZZ